MSLKLVKPKKLSIGDTIGIIAPSAGNANLFPHRIDNATKMLKSLGYKVKLSDNALKIDGYVSASAQKRVADIHAMFEDADVSAILCTIGGNHSNSLLKLIDFDLIKNNPKIFIGYSDISVLHYAFMKKSNLQTFYGPCIMTQFGEYPQILSYTLDYFNKAVGINAPVGEVNQSDEWTAEILDWTKKQDMERPRKLLKTKEYEWLKKGKVSGKIIGGCIPSINHLIGTDYWIDPTDMIMFIDIPEGHEFGKGLAISDLDSYLTDLDNIGVFENISGLIIGRPYNYSDEENNMLRNIVLRLAGQYDYPILFNVNIGHCDPIITLPYNADVILDSDKDSFVINSLAVS